MTPLSLHYEVCGDDFSCAGQASGAVKSVLKQLGYPPETIRRVAIAMYEGEINMVIHANGGIIDVEISPESVFIRLADTGPGIPDIDLALTEGFSTATEQIRTLGFGAGMGLPNMKRFTDEMNVESTVGVGTTVTMLIKASA
jgi:anti-sigma regulatory factor (Ser/Thr protein kinase)